MLIAILWLGGTYAFEIINKSNLIPHKVTTDVNADGNINIWWPTNNVRISNTQTFKAVVQDKNVSDYDMFWLVDGGQPNKMYDSSNDYPHKEAIVDLINWTWKGSGPYKVTFKAVDKNGSQLGEMSVDISTPMPAQGPTVIEAATSSATEAEETSTSVVAQAATQLTAAVTQAVTPNQVAAQQAVSASSEALTKNISMWWPTNSALVKGVQPFKGLVDGMSVDSYKMYWQVDNGNLNEMPTSNTPVPHKEVQVDVSNWKWKDTGPYSVVFTAKNLSGETIARTSSINITIDSAESTQTSKTSQQAQTTQTTKTTQTTEQVAAVVTTVPFVAPTQQPTVSSNGSNPFSGAKLWMNYNSDARKQANTWRTSRPSDAAQIDKIAQSPDVVWLGGWYSDIYKDTKARMTEIKSQGALPVFIAYNIPNRDCGQYSAGGVSNASAYRTWIQNIANAIGSDKAVVVLEPDALTLTDCLSDSQKTERFNLIKDSVNILKSKGNIAVYIDAGHPGWITSSDMADRLNKSGISQANGFALNISNFITTGDNIGYGQDISSKTGGKHFIIDTGRNGVGPTADNQWCNPWGRALGIRPTANTGNSLVDAYLWIKGPGGSDGNCNGGPNAGVWWADYALDMAKRSVF